MSQNESKKNNDNKHDLTKLNEIVNKFYDFCKEYREDMMELRLAIEDLGTVWKETDYDKFYDVYEHNAEAIEQMSKAFVSFGEIFTTTDSVDSDTTQSIFGMNNNDDLHQLSVGKNDKQDDQNPSE